MSEDGDFGVSGGSGHAATAAAPRPSPEKREDEGGWGNYSLSSTALR